MRDAMQKQLLIIEKKEEKLLNMKSADSGLLEQTKEKVMEKIPEGLKNTLNLAFYKTFCIVFEKGNSVIEKTYNKEKLIVDHDIHDFAIDRKVSHRHIKNMDKQAKRTGSIQSCVSAIEGMGLGLLGIGVPDIPIFITMILRGIYEVAISYGFDYTKEEEKYFVLLMIQGALCDDEQKKKKLTIVKKTSAALLEGFPLQFDLKEEIRNTSELLADVMLLMKFIQGLPIVGVVGGISNYSIHRRIIHYVSLQYKRRYLELKLKK